MELYYKRSNCLETVVFYLPDVWSCLPGTKEWSKLKSVYKYALCGEKNDVADKNILKAENETNIPSNGKQAEMSAVVNGTVGNETSLPVAGAESAADHGEIVDKTDLSGSILQEEDVMNNSGLLVIDEAASPAREDGGLDDVRTENVGQPSTSGDLQGTESSGKMETEVAERCLATLYLHDHPLYYIYWFSSLLKNMSMCLRLYCAFFAGGLYGPLIKLGVFGVSHF